MTLKAMMRIAGLYALILLALFIIVGNQRPADAQSVPLGSQIVCLVYTDLNGIGAPIPLLTAEGCDATTTPSGGGTLKVIKIVHGTSTPSSDFDINVKSAASDVNGSPEPGSSAGVSFMGLSGTFTVSETSNTAGVNVSDFTAAFSGGCTPASGVVVIASGDNETCTITNTWNGTSGGGGGGGDTTSDLSMTKTADKTTANPGDTVTYTLTVSNGGPASATGVSVADHLPAGVTYSSDDGSGAYNSTTGVWSVGLLANGASKTLHISVTVNSGTSGETVTNTATVSDQNGDNNSGNNTNSSSVTVNGGGGGGCTGSCGGGGTSATSSDVSITKSVDNSTPDKGGAVTYTITVSDTGLDATGVAVNDPLPSGLTFVATSSADTVGVYNPVSGAWTIGALSSTTPATLHITAKVNVSDDYGTVITNSAAVTSGDTSGDGSNDASSASLTVTNPNTGGGGGCTGSCGGGGGPSGCTGSCSGGSGPIPSNGPIVSGGGGGGGNGPIPFPAGIVLGASTSTDCSQFLTAFIKMGQKNDPEQVMRLQTVLHDDEGANIQVNGTYDSATLGAVIKFQSKYASDVLTPWGLKGSTGYVYLTTRKKINEIYCHNTKVFSLTPAQQKIISDARAASAVASGAPVVNANVTPSPAPKKPDAVTEPTPSAQVANVTIPSQIAATSTATTSPVGNPLFDFLGRLFGRH